VKPVVNNHFKLVGLTGLVGILIVVFSQTAFAADPAAGKPVYEKNGCSACHGVKGEGGVGPALSGTAFAAKYDTTDKLASAVRKGVGTNMPAYGEDKIGQTDLQNMVAYVQSLTPAAAPTKAQPSEAKIPVEAKAQVEAKVQAETAAVKTAPQTKSSASEKPADQSLQARFESFTLVQKYAAAVAVIGVLLILFFVVMLNGPLRPTRSRF